MILHSVTITGRSVEATGINRIKRKPKDNDGDFQALSCPTKGYEAD